METDQPRANLHSDPECLHRISRNYIRHNLTDYEDRLHQLFGKVGTEQAYARLKKRINRAISKVYGFSRIFFMSNKKTQIPKAVSEGDWPYEVKTTAIGPWPSRMAKRCGCFHAIKRPSIIRSCSMP